MIALCAVAAAACGGNAEDQNESSEVDPIVRTACERLPVLWDLVPESCRPEFDFEECIEHPSLLACPEEEALATDCLIENSEAYCTDDSWDFRFPTGTCTDEAEAAAACICAELGLGCNAD
jgi:hypothetical protein